MRNLLLICVDETDRGNLGRWLSGPAEHDTVLLDYSRSEDFAGLLDKLGVEHYPADSGKWKNIRTYFYDVGLGDYEYFWFPDPDLLIEPDQVNQFFRFAAECRFDLCQPSLAQNSLASHRFLKRVEGSVARRVFFIEIMCPCFSRQALERLLWTFDLSFSGYGLDLLWARHFQGFAVDLFTVRHSRPPSFHTRAREKGFPDPDEELREIIRTFNLDTGNLVIRGL